MGFIQKEREWRGRTWVNWGREWKNGEGNLSEVKVKLD